MPEFTGPEGGILAAMFMTGISFGWGLCMKIRVSPMSKHADKIETKYDQIMEKIEQRFWDGR